jgi:F-type H+-transporting ATPase subunit a
MMTVQLLASMNPLEHIASKELFAVGPFSFTNHMFMISLSSLLLMIVLPIVVRRGVLVRSGLGNAVEATCVYLREEVVRPFLKDETDKYIGFLWTMFFFILTMNLLGMLPLDRIIWTFTGWEHNNLGGTATANVWVTGALALFSFLLFHFAGICENGPINYIKHFAPKVPLLILPFIFFMEIVSSFVRMFSLAIRLFANMLAGHVLLATLLAFILIYKNSFVATASITVVTCMSLLEIFVAFLQAYIFTFLTAIFIGFAVHQDH